MHKRVNPAAAAMIALSLAMSSGALMAQTDTATTTRTAEADEGGFDLGWLGLLGLIGLMGLKRRDTHHTTTRNGTGTNTGYTAPR